MKSSRLDRFHLGQARLLDPTTQSGVAQRGVAQWCYPPQLPRIEKPKVVRGDRLDYQCALVDLILSVLASGGEPSPFFHGDCCRRRSHRIQTFFIHFTQLAPKPRCFLCFSLKQSQSNSVASIRIQPRPSRISLHRDHFGSVSARSNSALSQDSPVTNNSDFVEYNSTNTLAELEQMENNDITLKELATLDVVYQPWCIQYPQLEPTQTYELKSGLIHLLPKFHGLAREDPHKHLKEFHVVFSIMRPQGILEDYIKMKVFPFSLNGVAKDWLYLQLVVFNTWGDMKCTFLEKFFPASRTATIRKEIYGIRQHPRETLHEYWERFNKLYATCPHHQISEQLLIQYFYEGLSMMDRSMIDASGGALMDKTPTAARHLISNMASNTQQFGMRGPSQARMVNEIDVGEPTDRIDIAVEVARCCKHQPTIAAKVCGIYTSVEHPTDLCPTLQETKLDQPENIGAIGGYQHGKQPYQSRPIDNQQYGRQPFRPGPNQGPYAAQQFEPTLSVHQRQAAPPFQQQQQQRMPPQGNSPSLEDLMKQLATSNLEFQQSSAGSNNLPSQTIPNPRGNASVVTLKSGKELPQPTLQQLSRPTEADAEPNVDSQSRPEKTILVPFPTQTILARKPEPDKELLKMFCNVEINIPLLDAIKKILKYAKFLKELCVHKRKKIKENVEVGCIVSALTRNEEFTVGALQALPKKCRDPGIFSVPCTIGDCTFVDAMLDLGASINVMPTSIYKSLNFGDLEPTGMTIQLANRSVVQPLGVLEDVLVQVNELIFPADFCVLDMEDETSGKGTTLILGRPFLMAARIKIDVYVGTHSMEFGDTLVQFNIFEAMKHPTEDHSLFGIDQIDKLVEEYLQLDNSSEDNENFARSTDLISCLGSIIKEADYEKVHDLLNSENNNNDIADLDFEAELFEVLDQLCNLENLNCTNKAKVKVVETKELLSAQLATIFTAEAAQRVKSDSNPTRIERSWPKQKKAEIMSAHLVQRPIQVDQPDPKSSNDNSSSPPPPRELKPLPIHLKYAYLDIEQQLPIIIANNLLQEQENKLLFVLRRHKKAIRWKLSDLPGINPSICMHRILMEEEAKPIRQQQRRLNPTILDVVKKEVTKLLAAGIIYPISDSQWVSPVQVVPKKSGMTVMKNHQDELVPMRIQNSWRVCIDYTRLNQAICKDHFPLPFIDQFLEKL
ncbi:hypothetical protein CR513_08633, partial [Mucuna pruriens]